MWSTANQSSHHHHAQKKQAPQPPSSHQQPTNPVHKPMINLTTPETETKPTLTVYSNISEFDPLAASEQPGQSAGEPVYAQIAEVNEYYVAKYAFERDNDPNNQFLNMKFGQVVLVKRKCDLTGNAEWWHVQDRNGSEGYVPANRLVKYAPPRS